MAKIMPPRRLRQIDEETGEIIEGVVALIPVRRKNGFREGWFAMSNNATAQILTLTMNRELTLRDLQVLYAMLEVLETENFIRVSQRHLAERLDMRQPHVSRSIAVLLKHEIILLGPKIGSSSTYRLNPRFGWKGTAQAHQLALRDRMKQSNIRGIVAAPERDPLTVDMFTGAADAEKAPT